MLHSSCASGCSFAQCVMQFVLHTYGIPVVFFTQLDFDLDNIVGNMAKMVSFCVIILLTSFDRCEFKNINKIKTCQGINVLNKDF